MALDKHHHTIRNIEEVKSAMKNIVTVEAYDLAEQANFITSLLTDEEFRLFKDSLIRQLDKEINGGTVL